MNKKIKINKLALMRVAKLSTLLATKGKNMEMMKNGKRFPKDVMMKDFEKCSQMKQDNYPQGYKHAKKVQDESVARLKSMSKDGGVSSF